MALENLPIWFACLTLLEKTAVLLTLTIFGMEEIVRVSIHVSFNDIIIFVFFVGDSIQAEMLISASWPQSNCEYFCDFC